MFSQAESQLPVQQDLKAFPTIPSQSTTDFFGISSAFTPPSQTPSPLFPSQPFGNIAKSTSPVPSKHSSAPFIETLVSDSGQQYKQVKNDAAFYFLATTLPLSTSTSNTRSTLPATVMNNMSSTNFAGNAPSTPAGTRLTGNHSHSAAHTPRRQPRSIPRPADRYNPRYTPRTTASQVHRAHRRPAGRGISCPYTRETRNTWNWIIPQLHPSALRLMTGYDFTWPDPPAINLGSEAYAGNVEQLVQEMVQDPVNTLPTFNGLQQPGFHFAAPLSTPAPTSASYVYNCDNQYTMSSQGFDAGPNALQLETSAAADIQQFGFNDLHMMMPVAARDHQVELMSTVPATAADSFELLSEPFGHDAESRIHNDGGLPTSHSSTVGNAFPVGEEYEINCLDLVDTAPPTSAYLELSNGFAQLAAYVAADSKPINLEEVDSRLSAIEPPAPIREILAPASTVPATPDLSSGSASSDQLSRVDTLASAQQSISTAPTISGDESPAELAVAAPTAVADFSWDDFLEHDGLQPSDMKPPSFFDDQFGTGSSFDDDL